MILKFRAWDKIKKAMRYDVTGFEHGLDNEMQGIFLDGNYYNINSEANVMVYTGLKDTNGKEIYEGDILKYECCSCGEYHIVDVGTKGNFEVEICGRDYDYTTLAWSEITDSDCCEIIGNIYENKELLTTIK